MPRESSLRHGYFSFGAAVIVLLTFIVYWPVIAHGGFIWDDDSYVTENPLLHDANGLRRIWFEPKASPQYYPVVFTTFWIEHQLWGLHPRGYHITNVLLHALNALLVWRLAQMLSLPGAWMIAAVFAVHPVHVESVAWITERKNVLSGLFYLVAGISYLRFDDRFNQPPAEPEANGFDSSQRWKFYALANLFFVLALLSKSVTCSLPAALILMMLWQRKRITPQRIALLLPMFIVGLGLALHTAHLEHVKVGAQGEEFAFTFAQRLLIASKALLFYPCKLLWPWPVMFVYPRWEIDASAWASWWPVLCVLVTAAASLTAYARGWRGPFLALAFFAGTVFPALGFFNFYPMVFSFVADHFQYLASLGIIALAIAAGAKLVRDRRLRFILAGLILVALAPLAWIQAKTYQNAESVWRDTLRKNDKALLAHTNLGTLLARRAVAAFEVGEAEPGEAIAAQAESHLMRAIELNPKRPTAYFALSDLHRSRGNLDTALAFAQQGLEIIARMQEQAIARADIERPVSGPRADAHQRLAELHELLEDAGKAIEHYRAAGQWDPRNPQRRAALSRALRTVAEHAELAGRCDDALRHYGEAIEFAVDQQQRLEATYRMARMLAMHPDPACRHADDAVIAAERALRIAQQIGTESPLIYGVLSSAYEHAGRTRDAIGPAEQALKLAHEAGMHDLAVELERRLAALRAAVSPPQRQ